jgi:23S rRNA (cytosine1962-C5)-methyltransferase
MATLIVTPAAAGRLRAGHPWVYRTEIADLRGAWTPGGAVDVIDPRGRRLGRGFYNPRPTLACRLLTRGERDELGPALFQRRLEAALEFRRAAGLTGDAYRLCWSEADGLPGLVVDRYGPVSALQCGTLGMARAVSWVVEALDRLFPGAPVYRIDDPTAARLEGFEAVRDWIRPPAPAQAGLEIVVAEGDCRFVAPLGGGHKTGLYLDQRDNRATVAAHARGCHDVLDAFCFAGGFACHALRAGAERALLIDSSAEALGLARRNLALNGLEGRAEVREANAFDELRALAAAGRRFGLVVLDPPPFTRRKDTLEAAARGYKEINIRGLRLLEPGGVLVTFSCSHHVTPEMFESVCRDAAGDAGVSARVLAVLTQSRDHPVLLNVPETRYLTGLLLQPLE